MILFSASSKLCVANKLSQQHPFYIGILTGYGATTWSGLVPLKVSPGDAMTMSTPVRVREGGPILGAYAGYELLRYFALEINYIHWPEATVTFDPMSIYAFDHNGETQLITHTETAGLMAKFMIDIPKTNWRAFSSAGVAGTHRNDKVTDKWRINPAFALGVNTIYQNRYLIEFGGDYTAGYAESEIDPSQDFVPFLFSAFVRVAYRF